MKFSIIVPIYNRESTLSRCIESVLDQKYVDFECILVDDGSTDNSLVVCEKYAQKDDRISIILHMIRKINRQNKNFTEFVDAVSFLYTWPPRKIPKHRLSCLLCAVLLKFSCEIRWLPTAGIGFSGFRENLLSHETLQWKCNLHKKLWIDFAKNIAFLDKIWYTDNG